MKLLNYLALIWMLILISCTNGTELQGVWNLELQLQGKSIPFYIEFNKEKAFLKNNQEIIELTYETKNGTLYIPILNYDAAFELTQKDNILKGHWIKYNKTPEYKVNILGMKTKLKQLPDFVGEKPFTEDKKFKIVFDDNSTGLLNFESSPLTNHLSILTETGDFRFLTSERRGEKWILYGFDGLFSFFIEIESDSNKKYIGNLYSGPTFHQSFQMEEDSNFSLRDPSNITTAELKLKNMSLPNLDGNLEKIYEEGKGSIIQIFGSWCPNCIDETKFILEWRKEHKLNLNIKMVSFERSPNKEHALKMLKKTKALYGIDYPILIGGYNKEDKVSSIFPNLNNFTAFPTTLFVDKSGTILRIHVGFSGPATGKYYEKFKRDFNELAEYLAKE